MVSINRRQGLVYGNRIKDMIFQARPMTEEWRPPKKIMCFDDNGDYTAACGIQDMTSCGSRDLARQSICQWWSYWSRQTSFASPDHPEHQRLPTLRPSIYQPWTRSKLETSIYQPTHDDPFQWLHDATTPIIRQIQVTFSQPY